ncbi:MAG: hypothetical protein Q8R45_11760 [Brevundimonas sp.]|uniref:hypothetical protein n=1 Tax=Brevundimonas sp. TaxID=1871086 RepID=UPI002735358D|nr:hypothetical protein [Brevundimonas sp.]MDP3657629.1 hypothetical protein [Brevundimonas sp.]
MPKVSINDLRSRYAEMQTRRAHYEWKSENDEGRLKLHEVWRHEYLRDPYLLGATDERLAARFRDIFINQTELGDNALIGMLPVNTTDLMRKFTHLLEEYGARGGEPPSEVIVAARTPLLKYFENGPPIAVKMFEGYRAPQSRYLVKYGQREFLEPMLKHGRIRICQASHYNDNTHNAAVRDDEISRIFCFSTYEERLKEISHIPVQGHRIPIEDDDIVLPVEMNDYYLFSLCDDIYYRMPTDFGADAALVIKDPDQFLQRVISAFLLLRPDWEPLFGPVTYYDPYRDYTAWKTPEMAKPFGYAYQREFRIAFRARQRSKGPLAPEFLEIGPMTDFAELRIT